MRSVAILGALLTVGGAMSASPACASWRAADQAVQVAAKDEDIAAVLREVDILDKAIVEDDHPAFVARLASDLVVNNPQNTISQRGATGQRNLAGRISYIRYERTIEYAGRLEGMVLLMGEERVLPKGAAQNAGHEERRRFTDLWRRSQGHWLLAARQATVIGVD